MSWTCPHQLKDYFCALRQKECKPGNDGCVLAQRFKFTNTPTRSEPDQKTREDDKSREQSDS